MSGRNATDVNIEGRATVALSETAALQPEAARLFMSSRGLLLAVAYRVLGSVTDAEDVVQDAWLRWCRVDVNTVGDSEGYLVRVVIRLAIDRLRSAQVRRESYVGPWLPEPLLTGPDVAEDIARRDSVSTAMLLVLETLTPIERAVFVLSEAFGYRTAEVARLVGRSEAAVRKVAHRAKQAVHARRRRYDCDPVTRAEVTDRFLAACLGGDLTALMAVLAPDVTLISDGGGFTNAPRKPIRGLEYVARAIVVLARRRPGDSIAKVRQLNGSQGIVLTSGLAPVLAMTLDLVDGVIETVYVVSNPQKLAGVGP